MYLQLNLLLPLGHRLLVGSTAVLATAVVVLSTQTAHAQSADKASNKNLEVAIFNCKTLGDVRFIEAVPNKDPLKRRWH